MCNLASWQHSTRRELPATARINQTAIDMALDEVAAQFGTEPQRLFQINTTARRPVAKRGAVKRLLRDIHRKPILALLDHGQACAVACDRRADVDTSRVIGGLDGQAAAHI